MIAVWGEMRTPSKWQDFGHKFSGVFWFRRTVDIPAAWAGKDLRLHLGACDKHDTTYFNNVPVGTTGWETPDAWCTPREYSRPRQARPCGPQRDRHPDLFVHDRWRIDWARLADAARGGE